MQKKRSPQFFHYVAVFTLFTLLFLQACSAALQEKEPNDTNPQVIQIQTTELIELKSPIAFPDNAGKKNEGKVLGKVLEINGTLHSKKDKDCYAIESPNGHFQMELSAIKGINSAIHLLDPATGKVVKEIDDYRKSDQEFFPLSAIQKGRTSFCITQGRRDPHIDAGNVPYQIKFIYYALKLPEKFYIESEPNDTFASASPLEEGMVYLGFYAPAINWGNQDKENRFREEDWYRITMPADGEEKYFFLDVSPVPESDPVITIYNETGKEVMKFDNYQINQGESTPPIKIVPGGSYFIRLHSNVIKSLPYSFYTLRYKIQDSKLSQEAEPNNTMETANLLKDGQINAYLSHKEDVDFFAISVAKDSNYLSGWIHFPDSLRQSTIRLLRANQQVIFSQKASETGQNPFFFSGYRLEPGSYYLQILNENQRVDVKNPYQVSLTQKKFQSGLEQEPNDTQEQANSFTWHQKDFSIGPSYLSSLKDKDTYKITTEENKRARLRFTMVNETSEPLHISLTDKQGYVLKKVAAKGGGETSFTETIDGSGFVVIEPSKRADNANPYYIRISK